jgi:hypothetical protein
MATRLTRTEGTPSYTESQAYGARLTAALGHGRLTPAGLHRRLTRDYGHAVSRSTVYDACNGKVRRSRYNLEFAEICGVNQKWLATGEGFMFDMTGRLSNKEKAVRDIKRLLRQHVIPGNRADLCRLSDRFIDEVAHYRADRESDNDYELLAKLGM